MIQAIWSGGQTGVDRAALDFAIAHGLGHGGWIPKGRRAEDGGVPARYHMREHLSPGYPPRTEANVRDTNATVIFVVEAINAHPGSLLTASLCIRYRRPYIVLKIDDDVETNRGKLSAFLKESPVRTLNVAGPRGSRNPNIDSVKAVLGAVLTS